MLNPNPSEAAQIFHFIAEKIRVEKWGEREKAHKT